MNQPYRKLRRSRDNSVIGGVCGGLGDFFGIDPTLIRIAFAVAFFFFSTGFWIYVLLWLVVPLAPKADAPQPRPEKHDDEDDDWSDF